MHVDFSPFLHIADDGEIWWPLENAIKLAAGYKPLADHHRNLTPTLRALDNRVLTNERALIGTLSHEHPEIPRPRVVERDATRVVPAREFLSWLAQHICRTQMEMDFPNELMSAVCDAIEAQPPRTQPEWRFESLTVALDPWFDKLLDDLPEALRRRVKEDFFPMPWDTSSPDQRRSVAAQWDYLHDPATQAERTQLWEFWCEHGEVKKQIAEWEVVATPTALDKAMKEDRLRELRRRLAELDQQHKRMRGDFPEQSTREETADQLPPAVAPAEDSANTVPQQRQAAQEAIIQAEVRRLGLDPRKLPRPPAGKPGVKATVRDIVMKSHGQIFSSQSIFEKAWERLRKQGEIQDA